MTGAPPPDGADRPAMAVKFLALVPTRPQLHKECRDDQSVRDNAGDSRVGCRRCCLADLGNDLIHHRLTRCRRRCDPISTLGIGSPGLICVILRLGCTHKFKNPWIPWIFWSKPRHGGPNAFFRSTEWLSISTELLMFSTESLFFPTARFFAFLRYSSSFFNKNKEKEKKGRG